jgi:hypothetical protein
MDMKAKKEPNQIDRIVLERAMKVGNRKFSSLLRKKGLARVVVREGNMVSIEPDGTVSVIKKLPKRRTVIKGKLIHF